MKTFASATAFALATNTASFAVDIYTLDASHSQVTFNYSHLGFSTTYGMFSGSEGEISCDEADSAASSVAVSMPVKSILTGWDQRTAHFMSPDFFGAEDGDMVTFTSTGIEVTGDDTAQITGDLPMNDVTNSVVLVAQLTKSGTHPMVNPMRSILVFFGEYYSGLRLTAFSKNGTNFEILKKS